MAPENKPWRLPRVHRRSSGRPPTTEEARRRLISMSSLRFNRGQVAATVLTVALGVAMVAQVRNADEAGLGQLRQSELVALLDNASTRVDALQREVVNLEGDRDRLRGQQGDEAAAAAAKQRLASYEILAGTVPVEGQGITVFVNDAGAAVTQTMMLDAIQELRDAGAEAIAIGSVRVVASSYVGTTADGRLLLDGKVIEAPYRIVAIGESHTLAGAMAIPGGFSDSLRGAGATVNIVENPELRIDAVTKPQDARFAQPVPATPAP